MVWRKAEQVQDVQRGSALRECTLAGEADGYAFARAQLLDTCCECYLSSANDGGPLWISIALCGWSSSSVHQYLLLKPLPPLVCMD